MITAENFARPLLQKRRRQKRRRIPRSYQGGPLSAQGSRRNSPRPFDGFYNTLSCFIQGRFHEKLGPSAVLLEQMFSRFMEGEIRRDHSP